MPPRSFTVAVEHPDIDDFRIYYHTSSHLSTLPLLESRVPPLRPELCCCVLLITNQQALSMHPANQWSRPIWNKLKGSRLWK